LSFSDTPKLDEFFDPYPLIDYLPVQDRELIEKRLSNKGVFGRE
jgi:hypothetical protein